MAALVAMEHPQFLDFSGEELSEKQQKRGKKRGCCPINGACSPAVPKVVGESEEVQGAERSLVGGVQQLLHEANQGLLIIYVGLEGK